MSAPKVGFVSLGCPKALVDSERLLSQLRAEGYDTALDYAAANVVIVNTCGFIDSAIEESLDAIDEAMAENGKVIVTGCMGSGSHGDKIRERFPGLLSISGSQDFDSVMKALRQAVPPQHDPFLDLVPPQGIKLTPPHYAYLKVSEGCNHKCGFCIIPSMRGKLTSRPIDEVLREGERLVKAGVKELLVISQDTSSYGAELNHASGTWQGREYHARLKDLCEGLGSLGVWVRLHDVYPHPQVDQIIPLMAEHKLLPYLDIPFQHGSPSVLQRMQRPALGDNTLARIAHWRDMCPDITLRGNFIVGFPGETDAEFDQLLDWLDQAQLDRADCFIYSPVEGAAANALANPVAQQRQEERHARFMEHQSEIGAAKLQAKIGSEIDVMIDGFDDEGYLIGRSKADAPEIDGRVYLSTDGDFTPGEIVRTEVIAADEHDLNAEVISPF